MAIIHWNCRSFHTKYDEIHDLIHAHNPSVICLQKSYPIHKNPGKLCGYHAFNVPAPPGADRASGGVSTLVSNHIPHRSIPIRTTLQANAVSVTLHKTITICNIYLPPK